MLLSGKSLPSFGVPEATAPYTLAVLGGPAKIIVFVILHKHSLLLVALYKYSLCNFGNPYKAQPTKI